MTYNEIRKVFLDYFEKHGHKIVPSVSLIPNDPTLMFTVAGMVPFKKILQGTEPAFATRVADVQKCLRAGGKHNDLDEVGFDGTHHTFFEMLGNWSFGDYFKAGAIEMSWDLLTNVLKLSPDKLRVTTHTSDDTATDIWKKLTGKDAIRLGDKDNWWSAGDTGPCGPCTEIFYDMGEHIKDDDKRWVEVWNNVFMQYDRDANGNLTPLPKQNVDTGGGLERWAAILQGKTDNYDTDLFANIIAAAEKITGVKKTPENTPSFKIIADHLRSVGFAIADGVEPSSGDRGYVIRRILRRAMRHGQILGHRGELLSKLYPTLIEQMGDWYPELEREKSRVIETIKREEHAFSDMLENGMKLLENEIRNQKSEIRNQILPGAVAFKLYDTYGFPLDLTQMILRDKNIDVDVAGFETAMKEQKERSRADTRGTKTLWESRTDLPATDDREKYAVFAPALAAGTASRTSGGGLIAGSKILAILSVDEFAGGATNGADVEIALDRTTFYGTRGGQVGDTGILKKDDNNFVTITETMIMGNIVVHKGIVTGQIATGDIVTPIINDAMRIQTARAHTGAHLLQAALIKVLGDGVEQKGSKVSPDSVRFDFSFPRPMTADEIAQTEKLINEWIDADLAAQTIETDVATARSMGAMALFGEKYGDTVRVITVGNSPSLAKGWTAKPDGVVVSCELCGGTHITHTGEIRRAKINKEKSIASGIRRITMSVGDLA